MTKSQPSTDRLILAIAIGILVAFMLVRWWVWIAQYSWSSESCAIAIPVAVVLAGLVAAAVLAIRLLWLKWWRSGR